MKRTRPSWPGYAESHKNTQHGNFHFHSGGLITLRKQGNLLLSLRDLELVDSLLARQSRREGKDKYYYWRKFNNDIQKMIDDKVAELNPPSTSRKRMPL